MKLRKGWDVLLRALAEPEAPDLPFVVVSPSSTQPPDNFLDLAADLGVVDRVTYMGRAANQSLAELYRRCEVVVVPSRYEGFGLVPLEAFEAGKPVVASDVPALNEYLADGVNARLVASNDPLELATRDVGRPAGRVTPRGPRLGREADPFAAARRRMAPPVDRAVRASERPSAIRLGAP